ncbi:MAG: hypothetical protein EAZ77_18605 [Nostocales cyanobacterium]|nr:MAG: hypothetical protein EAZ77_18605 [Nostocales cyanobacterium]
MWLNSIISALPGALISGAVISSIFNWQLNQRRLQLQTTFELHREWNGESLRLSRNLGDKFLLAHPNKDLIQIDNDGSVNPEDSVHLWIIIGFYQRLWILIKYHQVKESLIPELFGESFIWWYKNCFHERLIPTKYDSSNQISELNNWKKF